LTGFLAIAFFCRIFALAALLFAAAALVRFVIQGCFPHWAFAELPVNAKTKTKAITTKRLFFILEVIL
jgi:hypothetical protein